MTNLRSGGIIYIVPQGNETKRWCGSMAEQLICNQQVVGSTPITSSNTGDFPSGQRGQTVNLLSLTSVVRIHHPPPKNSIALRCCFFIHCEAMVYHRRTKCGVYHQARRASLYIITHQRASVLRNDDIQRLRLL